MKYAFLTLLFLITSINLFSQQKDTLVLSAKDLKLQNLRTGNSKYLVFMRKDISSPSERLMLVNINKKIIEYKNRKVLEIKQQWESDGIVHTATTLLEKSNASTLYHEIWWKKLNYTLKFDFITNKVSFDGNVSDSLRSKLTADLIQSNKSFNLNWHSDLVLFPSFPYKLNRTIAVPFYDPGFGTTTLAYYTTTHIDVLKDRNGNKIACWVMERRTQNEKKEESIQRFWIAKKTKEVLKEEDQFPTGLRFKYKIDS